MGGNTTVEAPDPIDPAKVGRDSLQTQIDLAPAQYAAESTYRPQYAALDQKILADSLLGTNGAPGLVELYGTAGQQLSQQQIDANRAQREADVADVMALGPQARQAYLAANPELAATMAQLDARVNGARPVSDLTTKLRADAANYDQKTAIQQELERQAQQELAANGTLSATDLRTAQQTARAANATNGLYDSNNRIGAEILGADSLLRSRRNDARTFASGVDLAGQQALNAGRSFAGGVAEYDRALNNDELARMFGLASTYQSQATDPFQIVLGRSGVPAQTQGATGQAGYTQQSGAQIFDPFNDNITSIYSGNQANQLAAQTATANNKSGVSGAALGAIGTIGAGALIAF